jgi:DNA-binding transcriptional regulator YiaG
VLTESALFHRCRKALGLSLSAIARALLIAGDRNPRRWEDGTRSVSGPAWVALE